MNPYMAEIWKGLSHTERCKAHMVLRKMHNMRLPTQDQANKWTQEDYLEFMRRRAALTGGAALFVEFDSVVDVTLALGCSLT